MKRGIDLIRKLYPEPSEIERQRVLDVFVNDNVVFKERIVPRFTADATYTLWAPTAAWHATGTTDLINWQYGVRERTTQVDSYAGIIARIDTSLPNGVWVPSTPPQRSDSEDELETAMLLAEAAAGIVS